MVTMSDVYCKAAHLINLLADFGITGHFHKSSGPSVNYYSVMVKICTTQLLLVFILNPDGG